MRKLVAVTLICAAAPLHANEFAPQLEQIANEALFAWAEDPMVIEAIRKQNADHARLTEADIVALDNRWRGEVGAGAHPFIDEIMSSNASNWIRGQADGLGGIVSEVFVTDNRGLNVMQSAVTSDYWQGDEAKWQETFGKPAGTLHFGDVELDESSQTYQSQVSFPVIDPDSGEPLGAITVGINLEAL